MPSPSQIDVSPGFDPTGLASISGAQLLQLVGGVVPYTDKGFIVVTTDSLGAPNPPDASGTVKWQNYIWLRISTTAVTPYVWNPSGPVQSVIVNNVSYSLLQWQTIAASSIGIGTITGAMIADNTIDDTKLISISYGKLIGAPVSLPPSGVAGGSLSGNYPNPVLGNAVITGAMIATNTITGGAAGNFAAQTIQPVTDIAPNGVALTFLRTNAGATACEWAIADILAANLPVAGNGLKVPRVNAGATAYELVNSNTSSFGRVLQIVEAYDVQDNLSDGTHINITHTIGGTLTYAEGTLYGTTGVAGGATPGSNSGLIVAITPLSTTSKLLVEGIIYMDANAADYVAIALFKDVTGAKFNGYAAGTSAIAASAIRTNYIVPVPIRFVMVSGQTTEIDFAIRFGSYANTGYVNHSNTAPNNFFGGGLNSWLRVTEYI